MKNRLIVTSNLSEGIGDIFCGTLHKSIFCTGAKILGVYTLVKFVLSFIWT